LPESRAVSVTGGEEFVLIDDPVLSRTGEINATRRDLEAEYFLGIDDNGSPCLAVAGRTNAPFSASILLLGSFLYEQKYKSTPEELTAVWHWWCKKCKKESKKVKGE
jgi:hypothetical protein